MSHALTRSLGAWHGPRIARAGRLHASPARHAAEHVPPLRHGERLHMRSGEPARPVVGTDRAFYIRDENGGWHRIRWTDIATIGWSHVGRCAEVRTWSAPSTSAPIRVGADARFMAFANERVSASRLLSTRAEILPGVIGLVVALRDDDDGVIRWQIAVDARHVVDGTAFHDACARLIDELRSLAGC